MINNNKGRDIFYGIVAVATLIVAIIGATLAYFSVTASSNEGAVNATAALVSVDYIDGQQVSAQADSLIPADFDVVQNVYSHFDIANKKDVSEGNICIDKNNKQVCSIYRFSINSDVSDRSIVAFLNSEYNGFTYLNYAVYDVTKGASNASSEDGWVQLTDEGDFHLSLDSCDSENDITEDDCWTKTGTRKTYSVNDPTAMNSMFGYTIEDGLTANRGQILKGGIQTYDLVLFILNEEDVNQNVDQGQNYRGTISVEILDGGISGTGNGNIQGEGY